MVEGGGFTTPLHASNRQMRTMMLKGQQGACNNKQCMQAGWASQTCMC
jgi:hypothetical protein